jgi:hypothetical protein
MSDVRINGRRISELGSVGTLAALVARLDSVAAREGKSLTSIVINGLEVDPDSAENVQVKLGATDKVEALMESAHDLALQSLQVAQEMAELLVFDLKVATLNLWDNTRTQAKTLETLIKDCHLFLSLAARPVELLGKSPHSGEREIELCLRELDTIANHIENAVLLAAHAKQRDACHILVARVIPSIEKWLGLSAGFSDRLELGNVEFTMGAGSGASAELLT